MAAPSEAVLISVISTIGGIIVAYIVNVIAKKVEEKRAAKNPKDRIELAFEWYDRALKQRDEDNTQLRAELREALNKLDVSDRENDRLRNELYKIRNEYRQHKEDDAKPQA